MSRALDYPLAPPGLRWGDGAKLDDEAYIEAATSLFDIVQTLCGIDTGSHVLDIGCGQGRFLLGLVKRLGNVRRYVGLDVHRPSIDWLVNSVAPVVPWAEFVHVPYLNERYNPSGKRELAVDLGRFDRIVLHSVFSHMRLADIIVYLGLIRGSLAEGGKVYLTAFVEDEVPPETENPAGYMAEWRRPLHCVLLNRQEFERRVWMAGLMVEKFHYRIGKVQSAYVLTGRAA